MSTNSGSAYFDASRTGALAYRIVVVLNFAEERNRLPAAEKSK